MARSPSRESLSVDSCMPGRHLTCKTPVDLFQRGPSPNPDVKIHKRPGDFPASTICGEDPSVPTVLRNCALILSALGMRRSLSTGDLPRALSPPPTHRCAGSSARLSWAGGGGWLGAASRSCSTWVAVGDSRLPSPHRPQDLLQAINTKGRPMYVRRRLTPNRASDRLSHSEFSLDRLEVAGARELTLRDVERERGRPVSKCERNMMIFDWLHTLEEGAAIPPEQDVLDDLEHA